MMVMGLLQLCISKTAIMHNIHSIMYFVDTYRKIKMLHKLSKIKTDLI
jgi:hypothetical protein